VAVGVATGTATEPAVPPLPLQPAAVAAAPHTKSSARMAILSRMQRPLREKQLPMVHG
jgi:hypothetical protein